MSFRKSKFQVYVEIPPSPLPRLHAAASLKQSTSIVARATPLKRKFSQVEVLITTPTTMKKQKLFPTAQPAQSARPSNHLPTATGVLQPKGNNMEDVTNQGSTEHLRCHQCNGKRDVQDVVKCTFLAGRQCAVKYCKTCVKARYNTSLEEIKAINLHKPGHVNTEVYQFKCYRCRDICNCASCRKKRGLPPLGKLKGPMPAELLISPKKPEARVLTPALVKLAPTAPMEIPIRPLPLVKWTALTNQLPLEEACKRIQIREFILRFAPIMTPTIPKSQLNELGCAINGSSVGQNNDGEMIYTWVSELCVKSMILGLLGLFAYEETGEPGKIIKQAQKEIRGSGAALNKIWLSLLSLRNALNACSNDDQEVERSKSPMEQDNVILSFPDPLSPPKSAADPRQTRSNGSPSIATLSVSHTAQFVPVLIGLVNEALQTVACSTELEDGVTDGKDLVRDCQEANKIENENWKLAKEALVAEHNAKNPAPPIVDSSGAANPSAAAKGKVKDKELQLETKGQLEHHKSRLAQISHALKTVQPGCATRFSPLGTDAQKRVYFALSPNYGDRTAALDFIARAKANKKQAQFKKPVTGHSKEDRALMRDWSMFIAVWQNGSSDNEGTWYGFCEPEDIRAIAKWITIKDNLDIPLVAATKSVNDEKSPSREQLQTLVKSLNEYADVLEWKVRDSALTEEAAAIVSSK